MKPVTTTSKGVTEYPNANPSIPISNIMRAVCHFLSNLTLSMMNMEITEDRK
jgi:hypothetical protein